MKGSRQARPAVLDRDMGDTRASRDKVADHLGVDARGEDEIGSQAPEAIRARDRGDIRTRAHTDEPSGDALSGECVEVRPLMPERGHSRVEAVVPKLRDQQRKLTLSASDAQGGKQE